MLRRELLWCGGCGATELIAATAQQDPTKPQVVKLQPRYKFQIEVVAPRQSLCHAHRFGERFAYPEDLGKICPWLFDSMSGILRAMEWGAVFPWDYDGTPYKKVSDPNGVCTEFVHCPDPTANGIVVKITRRTLKA